MTKEEFDSLKIGDTVVPTEATRNVSWNDEKKKFLGTEDTVRTIDRDTGFIQLDNAFFVVRDRRSRYKFHYTGCELRSSMTKKTNLPESFIVYFNANTDELNKKYFTIIRDWYLKQHPNIITTAALDKLNADFPVKRFSIFPEGYSNLERAIVQNKDMQVVDLHHVLKEINKEAYEEYKASCNNVVEICKHQEDIAKETPTTRKEKKMEAKNKMSKIATDVVDTNKDHALIAGKIVAGQTIINRLRKLTDSYIPKEGIIRKIWDSAFGDLVISNVLLFVAKWFPQHEKLNAAAEMTNLAAMVSTKDKLEVQKWIDSILDGIEIPGIGSAKETKKEE